MIFDIYQGEVLITIMIGAIRSLSNWLTDGQAGKDACQKFPTLPFM